MALTNATSETEIPYDGEQERDRESSHHAERHGHRSRSVNVGVGERYGSVLGGSALILAGLARRGIGGALLGALGAAFLQRGATGQCQLYRSIGVSSAQSNRAGVPDNVGTKVERGITINRRPEEIFQFWRDLRNLPQFMPSLERVEILQNNRSHWVVKSPGGRTVEWDAEIINEHPNELIAWQGLPGAEVENAGSVRFKAAPGGRGTEVKVSLEYNPPGGILGVIAAKLFGVAPEQQLEEDLWRLKQILEAGEIATTEGQPTGTQSRYEQAEKE